MVAGKATASDRDKALISILERMADQLQKQDSLLGEIVENQFEYQKAAATSELRSGALIRDTDTSIEKIGEAISRYRSDMLSLVNEQDQINVKMKELSKLVNNAAYSLEKTILKLDDFDVRLKAQEKAFHSHYEHSLEQASNVSQRLADLDSRSKIQEKYTHDHYKLSMDQAEALPKEIANADHHLAKLHADTEKRLGEMYRDSQQQLDKLQHETIRRLLILENIDSALKTLLIRTEPIDKEPLLIVRAFKMVRGFFRTLFTAKSKKSDKKPD